MGTSPKLTYRRLDHEDAELLDRFFQRKDRMVEVFPGNVILPHDYTPVGQEILDLQVHADDVWLCSYPRSGSTWAQEMVWLIGHYLDFEGAKTNLENRCPLVELAYKTAGNKELPINVVRNGLARPRYIRSHLPWELLPVDLVKDGGSVKPKVIYTGRNPKDVVTSYYHYATLVHDLRCTFEEFCGLFMRDHAPFGSVWKHILAFWERRDDPNLLFIKYEEMKQDLPSVIRKTAKFLEKDITDDQVTQLCDHLSFKNMRTNRAVNLETVLEKSLGKDGLEQTDQRFIRKGEVGDWKNHMSEDLSRKFDEWAEKNLKGTGLSFE